MKNLISHHLRFKAILRVIGKYLSLFNGKPEVLAATELFAANTNRIGKLLASLARPRKTLSGPKIDKELKLRKSLFSMADLGILMGTRRQDTPQVNLFKEFRKASWKYTAWAMHNAAEQVYTELAAYPEVAANIGITAEILESFQQQVQEFNEILDTTDRQYKDRKSERGELRALFTDNSALLKEQIEPVIRFESVANPGLYREYRIARSTGARKKPEGTADLLTDISGVVTDIVTGNPVANAIVDIVERELITTTDADGYYLFDEQPAGESTVGCHAPGYRLPEKVKVTAASGESLLVDFNLQPEAVAQTA